MDRKREGEDGWIEGENEGEIIDRGKDKMDG